MTDIPDADIRIAQLLKEYPICDLITDLKTRLDRMKKANNPSSLHCEIMEAISSDIEFFKSMHASLVPIFFD